jgi:hypothetical protein
MASAPRISAPASRWDSIFLGKFGPDGSAPRAALDMYPRKRGKLANTQKSPENIDRNARRMASPTEPEKTNK